MAGASVKRACGVCRARGSARRRSESPSDQPHFAGERKETDARLFRRKRGVVKTTRERAEEKRQEKLANVREQLKSGSLVIRQMTDAERRRYPPRPRPPQRWAR